MHSNRILARLRRRRARAGVSLIEIVVTVGIIAMLSAGIAVAVIKIANQQKIEITRNNATQLRAAVKIWWATTGADGCPTVGQLLVDGELDKSKATKADAWQEPWRIRCEDADAVVISKGPDKQPDTEDDIRVPSG
jgi:type II secretory pathway pseudopilin PulG